MKKLASLKWTGRPPTKKNSQSIVYRGAKPRAMIVPSKVYKRALAEQLPQIAKQWKSKKRLGSSDCLLWCKFDFSVANNRRMDLDNLITAALDLLQKANVISNDTWVQSLDGSRVSFGTGEDFTAVEIHRMGD